MKKIVLITGGSSNLGLEIIKKLKDAGYVIYAPTGLELNITNETSCLEFVHKIAKVHGRIDILINCAGITRVGLSLEESASNFLKTLDINAVGAFRLTKEVVKYMGKKSEGKIINIGSLNGIISLPNYGMYSASKHAFEAMFFALRQELRDRNIYVTNILPGAILNEKKTNLLQTNKPAREKIPILKYLMPFITPRQVAESVLKIAESKTSPARVILGNDAKITTLLMKILPFSFWDRLVFYVWDYK